MSRDQLTAQRNRTQANPLVLGTFDTTTLRYLKGRLGPQNKLIGYKDTSQTSNGGFGGGSYNHWFQINLTDPGWIIVTKGLPRPKYIQVSAYDLDTVPIQGRGIFDDDSVSVISGNELYHPYFGHVMQAQSDLYNNFAAYRVDRGDDRYYTLPAGSYLICISTTRNEPLDYEVGIIVEFPPTELAIGLEDEYDIALLLQETAVDFNRTIYVTSPVVADVTVSAISGKPNGFTETEAIVNTGVTVTILDGSTWFIGDVIPSAQTPEYVIYAEPQEGDEYFNTIHDHSLSEWQDAWESQHQDTDKFPTIFVPLANRP